eukprot:m51a1_g6829 hypothetical protein (153) ;mRNA; f:39988-40446
MSATRFTIQSRSSGRFLDGGAPKVIRPLLADSTAQQDTSLQWELVPIADGRFAIQSSSSGGFLDGRDPRTTEPILTYRQPALSDFYLQWSLVPVAHRSDVALLSRSSGGYLDGRKVDGVNGPTLGYCSPANDTSLHWIVKPLECTSTLVFSP